ncbi:MAG: hypothetical protein H7Z42_07350 [Roseiflexaceae bacterium]|nr:hypothetical protein [Roseiflexaceae bacterium]
MTTISRVWAFAAFTLLEYGRSGRILIEVITTIVLYYLLFRGSTTPMTAEAFFSLAGLLMLAMAFYTTAMMLGLGDRAQGYLVLSRRLGRSGYLLGLYGAAVAVLFAAYGGLSLITALLNPIAQMDITAWLAGSLPLLLNVLMVAAAVTLLAPMVLPARWRLALLCLVALAFSGSIVNSQALRDMGPLLRNLLGTLQVLASAPLLPAFSGFALAVTRDYSGAAVAVPLAQLSLTLGLLVMAIYAFGRREVIFQG